MTLHFCLLKNNSNIWLSLFLAADSRCFLESGSSAESFFVSEDLPVGSVIGKRRRYFCLTHTAALTLVRVTAEYFAVVPLASFVT